MLTRLLIVALEGLLFTVRVVDATQRQLGNAYNYKHGSYR